MRRRISAFWLIIWGINSCFAQLPVPLGSEQQLWLEARRLQEREFHTAIQPLFLETNDTFFIKPVIEAHLYAGGENFGILGLGPETYWKKNNLSIWLTAPIGTAHNPSWWQHNTMPFIGRAIRLDDGLLWTDVRLILSYKTKYITFQAGRSKFHLGQADGSVWLNDYAPALPFVRAIVQVPHVVYGYQINYLQNPDLRFGGRLQHAFNFTHYLDFNFGPLTINMFETVVQDPIDSLGARRGLDVNYFNPVIFFRAVDLLLGSPDNVLLGLGGSLRLKKKILLYGYGILDEMIVSQLLSGNKCWCLKYGANAGMKIFHPLSGDRLLFLQVEISGVRPYTYSHDNPVLAYGALYQPLAHPLGANFYQTLAKATLINNEKFSVDIRASASVFGQDIDTLNYGKDIFRSYLTRVADMGVITTQGQKTTLFYLELGLGKKLRPNLWLRTALIYTRLTDRPPLSLLNISLSSGLIRPRWDWR